MFFEYWENKFTVVAIAFYICTFLTVTAKNGFY